MPSGELTSCPVISLPKTGNSPKIIHHRPLIAPPIRVHPFLPIFYLKSAINIASTHNMRSLIRSPVEFSRIQCNTVTSATSNTLPNNQPAFPLHFPRFSQKISLNQPSISPRIGLALNSIPNSSNIC